MTVAQRIKKDGWQFDCSPSRGWRVCSVDVDFEVDGRTDETQFDIHGMNITELSHLFEDFCEENDFPCNTVVSVIIVATAPTMDELVMLTA